MLKIYEENLTLRSYQCDLCGTWKPSAILEEMQEAAGTHAELLGFGRKEMLKSNLVWVVSRNEVFMNRYPRFNETVHVRTFPAPVRRWLMPRYFIFEDSEGNRLGHAGSIWLLLDVNERKMVKPDIILSRMPDNSDLELPAGLPSVVQSVDCENPETNRILPVYSDLDMNVHVNNTKYMDWCCNSLGIDTMKDHIINHFVINYTAQIRPGTEIITELRRNENSFSFSGIHEEMRHFDIGGELQSR